MSDKNEVTRARVTSGDDGSRATRLVRGVFATAVRSLAILAIAAFVVSVWLQAVAAPPGAPQANRIFAACTFTTASLRAALTINSSFKNKFADNDVQASYILIYVRTNPNDGQKLDGTPPTFTGPVLCVNSGTESIDQTTETTVIPTQSGVTSVDILDAEEALHLRYKLNPPPAPGKDIEKRVCHTANANSDCFFIRAK
jgi:hypothetical protein